MKRTLKVMAAVSAVAALGLAGCSNSSTGAGGNGGGDAKAVITADGSEPQNPLIPANTNEVGGGKIIDLVFAGLSYYDAKGAIHNDMAEAIETKDSVVYTIKLKKGQKFSDGTEVKAKNFVDAWNIAVAQKQLSSYFFEPIKGYPADEKAKVDKLEGLAVTGDYEFTVTLNQPEADFPLRLGYSAFFPLPDSALEAAKGGPEALNKWGQHPIGNGPYKIDGEKGWVHNESIKLVPNTDYKGARQPKNGGVLLKFYAKQDAAYSDLISNNGSLDVLDAVPDSAFKTFKQDLGDRAINQPTAIFQSFIVPARLKHFGGEEGKLRRAALSLAINRAEICEKIFSNTRTPARDFSSPVIAGFNDKLPGSDVLDFNASKAKELWAKADAISKWDGKFELAYNADGGHQAWVDAAMNSVKNTLGIEAVGKPYPDFKSLRSEITDRKIQTAFRAGWQGDYPSLSNFLGPLYGTGAGSNDGDYSNPEFDKLLKQAAAAKSIDEANQFYYKAQEILFKDLPAIPLWYANTTGGYAEGVKNVQFGWNSVPLFYEITK